MNTVQKKELPKLFRIIKDNFWKLVIVNGAVAVIAVVILLLLPSWYRSTAVVISEDQQNQLNVTSAGLSNIGFGGSGLFGRNDETLRYIRYLKSRTIADKVINEFNLMTEWDKEFKTDIYKKLNEDVSFIDNEDGSISISVIYKEDPVKAAEIANYYVSELLSMIKKFENNYRNFVEDAYNSQNNKLYNIETSFGVFQKKTGIYNLEKQSEFAFQALTQLEVQKLQIEIQRDVFKKSLDATDPRLKELDYQIQMYENKITDYKQSNKYSNIPVDKLSEQGIEFLRQYRDLMVQEQIVQFLSLEYEQAKLSDQKDEIKLNIIDNAVPADMKYKPKRASSLIIILLFSGLLSIIAVNFKETYL